MTIQIEKTASSRLPALDLSAIEFGNVFSDHLFRQDWRDGVWQDPRIIPHQAIALNPAALGLHYGQVVFEGLKAYRGTHDNIIRLAPPLTISEDELRESMQVIIRAFERFL